jgi:NAD(P)-dependent dehydrogenase (short-subunit alcohol dehydrogenase family)
VGAGGVSADYILVEQCGETSGSAVSHLLLGKVETVRMPVHLLRAIGDQDMRVLITGAEGNLGAKLASHLQDRYKLVLLGSHVKGNKTGHHFDLSVWDEAWAALFDNVDVAVHLAANPSPSATWTDLIPANIDMVLNVYEACLAGGVSRVVFASSNHVMSGYRHGEIAALCSDTPPDPGNPYGATKLMGERIGKSYSERHGISSINVRIGWNRHNRPNVPSADMGEWGRRMWLSDRDYCQLMECCITAPRSLKWAVINGVSKNTGTRWSLTEAEELLGYRPVDDAFDPEWD